MCHSIIEFWKFAALCVCIDCLFCGNTFYEPKCDIDFLNPLFKTYISVTAVDL